MQTSNRFTRSLLSTSLAAAMVSMASFAQPADGPSDPIYYSGTARLCAVSQNMFDPPNQRGNSGASYMDDLVMVWQIHSLDTELMQGHEVMSALWMQTKSGVTFQSGELVMTPYVLEGTGAFEEKFKFKIDGSDITGIYTGTGDLKGVTGTYHLQGPINAPEFFCDADFDWMSLCPDCMPLPFPNGYNMSGWIEGY